MEFTHSLREHSSQYTSRKIYHWWQWICSQCCTAVIASLRTFPYLCFFTLTFHLVWSFLPPLNSCSGKTCIICDFSHALAAILETVASWTLCCTPVLSIYAFAAGLVNIATDCSDQTAERFNGIRENCYLASLGPLFCSAACQWLPLVPVSFFPGARVAIFSFSLSWRSHP